MEGKGNIEKDLKRSKHILLIAVLILSVICVVLTILVVVFIILYFNEKYSNSEVIETQFIYNEDNNNKEYKEVVYLYHKDNKLENKGKIVTTVDQLKFGKEWHCWAHCIINMEHVYIDVEMTLPFGQKWMETVANIYLETKCKKGKGRFLDNTRCKLIEESEEIVV